MRILGRIALIVFVSVVGLIAVLLVRTLTYKGPVGADVAAVKVAPAIAVDTNLAAIKDAEYVGRASQELRDLEQAIEDLLPSGS